MMSAKYFEYYIIMHRGAVFSWTRCITRTTIYSYGSKFSFLQRTFTTQLPTDGRATCRIGINNAPACNWGSVRLRSDIKGTELPPANTLITLERQLIALQLCR